MMANWDLYYCHCWPLLYQIHARTWDVSCFSFIDVITVLNILNLFLNFFCARLRSLLDSQCDCSIIILSASNILIYCGLMHVYMFLFCGFKAPELHMEIHKHGLAQQAMGQGPSASTSTKVNICVIQISFLFFFLYSAWESTSIDFLYGYIWGCVLPYIFSPVSTGQACLRAKKNNDNWRNKIWLSELPVIVKNALSSCINWATLNFLYFYQCDDLLP